MLVNSFFGQFCQIKRYLTNLRRQAEKVLRINTSVVNKYLKTINCETSGEYPTIALIAAVFEICV